MNNWLLYGMTCGFLVVWHHAAVSFQLLLLLLLFLLLLY